jgi:hypothetical protein
MRQADPQYEAAAERSLRGQGLLRESGGVPRVGRHDGGAELDAGHLAADHGQSGDGVEAEDVRQPGRPEPVGGGGLDLLP